MSQEPEQEQQDFSLFGMKLFLAGLTMLFGGSMVGYLIVRLNAEQWPPPGIPPVPWTIWISTAVMLLSSVTIHGALDGVREGNQRALRSGLVLTALLGLTFLISQVLNGAAIYRALLSDMKDLFSFTFFMLTTLHAAHIIGGLIALGIITRRAFRGVYDQEHHTGVQLTTWYWHYLDVVWLVLCIVLTV